MCFFCHFFPKEELRRLQKQMDFSVSDQAALTDALPFLRRSEFIFRHISYKNYIYIGCTLDFSSHPAFFSLFFFPRSLLLFCVIRTLQDGPVSLHRHLLVECVGFCRDLNRDWGCLCSGQRHIVSVSASEPWNSQEALLLKWSLGGFHLHYSRLFNLWPLFMLKSKRDWLHKHYSSKIGLNLK